MSIGIWELVLILVIVFVVFGPGKLPAVMGEIGKGIKNLKGGLKDDTAKLTQDESKEKEANSPKKLS